MSDSIRDILAREAAEAEARADAEERGEVEPARGQRGRQRAADPSQVYAVRIPVSRLRELRQVADLTGIPPTTLIREWVIERLEKLHVDAADLDQDGPPVSPSVIPLQPGEVRLGPRRRATRAPAEPDPREERQRA
jgi:hypothetical protein